MQMKKFWQGRAFQMITSLSLFVLSWYIASTTGLFGRYPPRLMVLLLPTPLDVARTVWEMAVTGNLARHLGISLYRVTAGFALAVCLGVPLGVAMGRYRTVNGLVEPLIRVFQPIPGVAWVPLAIVWFGLGDKAAIFIITISSLFPVLLNTIQGMRDVDGTLISAALTMGANSRQIAAKVLLPSLVPYLITGFRIGMGFAWRVVIAAEMVGVPSGLGYMLSLGRGIGRTDITIVTMVALGTVMLLIEHSVFIPMEHKTLNWKKSWGR